VWRRVEPIIRASCDLELEITVAGSGRTVEGEGLQLESLVHLVALRKVCDEVASASGLGTEKLARSVGRVMREIRKELLEPGCIPAVESIDERVNNLTSGAFAARWIT